MNKREQPSGLALIGAGYWGWFLSRNCDHWGVLLLLCDDVEEALGRFRAEYDGLETCPDLEPVFANEKITRVALATPAEMQYRMATRASAGRL